MQLNAKLAIKGFHSPLKLKIDYIDASTGQKMNKGTMLLLKGHLNIYLSKKYRNPQPATDPLESTTATCEQQFVDQVPPRKIEVHSNEQHVQMVPFYHDYCYFTFDCADVAILDQVILVIKCTTNQPASASTPNQRSNSHSEDDDGEHKKARQL